jgi:IS30 family transposase
MAEFEAIENRTGPQVYFATPYHSWERGTNENTNGLLRHYFSKQMSFAHLTQAELDAAVREINTRPRKRLGYKTPSQVLKVSGAFRIGV